MATVSVTWLKPLLKDPNWTSAIQ